MPEFITLSCPSCGGKLEITEDIERFACSHCGREHIVKRGGGIVSLSPVVEGLKKVEIGVDKTASELALVRIEKEINVLKGQRLSIDSNGRTRFNYLVVGILFLILGLSFELINHSFLCLIPGIVFILIGLSYGANHDKNKIASLDEQIASKEAELEQNRKLVSK